LTFSPSPQTVHQSFLEWQPTNLPRDYQLNIRHLSQLGNQVLQVTQFLTSLAVWLVPPPQSAASASRWAVGASARRFAGAFRGPAPQGASGLAANGGRWQGKPSKNGAFGRDVREKTPQNLIVAVVFWFFPLW